MSIENQDLKLIEGGGQTTNPDGSLKEMSDDQLKKAQSARSSSSGISAKDGGSLTMPAKWRGKVKDSNTEWGDWTNYSFPIHDLAHANNAAARLAQNSGYSSEEKSKISGRIEAAQKRFHKQKSSFVIISEDGEVKLKDYKTFKADMMGPVEPNSPDNEPDEDDVFYTKDEVDQMMNYLYSCMSEYIGDMYSRMTQSNRSMAGQMNDYIGAHTDGHLPPLHPGQVQAMLEKCGIADEFAAPKPPMIPTPPTHIYSSFDEAKEKLKSIEFKVK